VTLSIALLSYSTRPRGGVVHTLALAEALAAEGQAVTVWTLGRGGDAGFFRAVDPAVRQRIVPFPEVDGEEVGARVLRSIDTLRSAFDPRGYDIVHAQDCISANAVGRCVRTVHHIDHFTTPELAACHERAITTPHAHVCVSEAVAGELRDGWGISATVIPNGVDFARFADAAGTDQAAAHARQRWRDHLGRFVLAVGGIEPRKGSLELLDAYALLRDDRPDLKLVIAGGETLFDYREYRAEWESRAAALGVTPVVLGPVAHDDLPALIASAAVFAFPSAKEGFGLAARRPGRGPGPAGVSGGLRRDGPLRRRRAQPRRGDAPRGGRARPVPAYGRPGPRRPSHLARRRPRASQALPCPV
jgi:glycosyltransferase-like protein